MKTLYSTLILTIVLTGCHYCEPLCTFDNEDIANTYSSYVEDWKREANASFDKAEKVVFEDQPSPTPEPVGPHPDPKKCICGGKGVIVHGDDHKTPCPYHSGSAK